MKRKPVKLVDKDVVRLCTFVWNYFVLIQGVPMRAIDVDQDAEEKLRNDIYAQMKKVMGVK